MSYDEWYNAITYKALANAINGIAHWLTKSLGPGHGEILAYLGPNDLRYPALVLGAVKAGYCMFLTSPRNSTEAHRSLLGKLNCTNLLAPVPYPPFVQTIVDAIPGPFNAMGVPSLDDLLTTEYPPFKYHKVYPHDASDRLVVLHTSGSTGIPKPIIWTLESAVKHMHMQRLEIPAGYEGQDRKGFGKRMYLTMPPFHAAGIGHLLIVTMPVDVTLIMPTATGLPTAANLELAQDAEALEYSSTHLEYVIYAGGDLPQAIGNIVAAKIPLMNGFGSSELGMLNVIHSPNRDPLTEWRYLQFHPELGVEHRHVSGGEYEAVLMISLSSSMERKTNPVSMEQHIVAANTEVTGCLVVGAQRFQAALLVELDRKSLGDDYAAIGKLWPSIEEANIPAPAHARIAKSHILFTSPEKPKLRAAKGTIQRASTLKIYAREIEKVHTDADEFSQLGARNLPGPGGVDDVVKVTEFIRGSILAITGWSAEKLSDGEIWFNLGFDSLQAITATRVLKQGLNFPNLTSNVIYMHPTVTGLTHALLHQGLEDPIETKSQSLMRERDELLQEFIGQIEAPNVQCFKAVDTQTVILTGSTGQLGTYLLDTLLKTPSVKHVYCLNRADRARGRRQERVAIYGLDPVNEARVTFWQANLSQAGFGLQPEQLRQLQQTATLVIHNAWAVNFNLSLASFKPQLAGVVNLVNFTGQARHAPRLFFISSISSTMGYGGTNDGLMPETVIKTTIPAPNGYANSKYIAEHLLAHAVQQGYNPALARVGQVAGPIRSHGLWSKSEWFPSLVLSSLHLSALPETIGQALDRVDWVPVDLLAEILVDLSLLQSPGVGVYHPVNLHPQSWKDIRPMIADALQVLEKTTEIIPLQEWILRVRQDIELVSQDKENLQIQLAKDPAAKLLDFFEDVMQQTEAENALDARGTALISQKLQMVDAVQAEWIQKWVKEWVQ
ncbi:acetyl-CoA synthetase-like protein [Penicillium frequentans]|uniref:Acetyl-CoA synthetase-like protein n=1 Tax=Penicillium frequentans TaxID=3151616 RepID=A0AAD6GAT3_9EURO|nr:acetyl-CoA synthetase-like protein [Penicillium glabrum]